MARYFFFIIYGLYLFSCTTKNIDDSTFKEERQNSSSELLSVNINLPNLKSDTEEEWIYGIKIYQIEDGAQNCYAYGLFSDMSQIFFEPEFNKRYYFEATAINQGTGLGLYKTFNQPSGYYRYYSPVDSELDNQFHYQCPTASNWYFDPASNYTIVFENNGGQIRDVISYMPELIRYYGESDTLLIDKNLPEVNLDLINASYGVNYTIQNMQEGDSVVVVLNSGSPGLTNSLKIVFPEDQSIRYYEFGDVRALERNYFKPIVKPEIPRHVQEVNYQARVIHKDGTQKDIGPINFNVSRNETTIVNIDAQ